VDIVHELSHVAAPGAHHRRLAPFASAVLPHELIGVVACHLDVFVHDQRGAFAARRGAAVIRRAARTAAATRARRAAARRAAATPGRAPPRAPAWVGAPGPGAGPAPAAATAPRGARRRAVHRDDADDENER